MNVETPLYSGGQGNQTPTSRAPLKIFEIIVAVVVVIFTIYFFIVYKKGGNDTMHISDIIASGDVSLCDKIINGNDRIQCRGALQYKIFSKKAVENNDSKICLSIDDEFLRERCSDPFLIMEAIAKKDVSLCPTTFDTQGQKVFIDEQCPNLIYMSLAGSKKDTSLCKKISNKNLYESCVKAVENGVVKGTSIFGPAVQIGGEK